jgi:hypothetical protein
VIDVLHAAARGTFPPEDGRTEVAGRAEVLFGPPGAFLRRSA